MKSISFISFEGLDASGKTTLMNNVNKELTKHGIKTIIVNKNDLDYNYNEFVGERLKKLNSLLFECKPNDNLKDVPEKCWIYLNAVWFSMVSKNYVEPYREKYIVLTDSWVEKRLARFKLLDVISKKELEYLYDSVSKPDLSFFVDINSHETWKRRQKHSKKDFGFLVNDESLCTKEAFIKYQCKIYDNYVKQAEKEGWYILNGQESSEMLTTCVVEYLLRRIKNE